MVFNPGPGDPPLCTFCMSLLSDTQCSSWISLLMSGSSESGVLNKGDMQNVQSGGSPGTGLKTTAVEDIKYFLKVTKMPESKS